MFICNYNIYHKMCCYGKNREGFLVGGIEKYIQYIVQLLFE